MDLDFEMSGKDVDGLWLEAFFNGSAIETSIDLPGLSRDGWMTEGDLTVSRGVFIVRTPITIDTTKERPRRKVRDSYIEIHEGGSITFKTDQEDGSVLDGSRWFELCSFRIMHPSVTFGGVAT